MKINLKYTLVSFFVVLLFLYIMHQKPTILIKKKKTNEHLCISCIRK